MKRIISLCLTVLLVFGATVSLSSCTPKDAGAEISIYLGDAVYDLDPSDYYADDNAAQVMSLLFEPLFSIAKNGSLKMAAAKSYKISRIKHTVTIKLRESYWSDGNRVTAQDFVYAWRNRILDPDTANSAAALFYDIENAVEVQNGTLSISELGVEIIDLDKILIHYRDGANVKQLLRNLASVSTSPVRQNVAEGSASTYWSKITNTAVTNGPFKIRSYKPETGAFTLERNKGYHLAPDVKNYTKRVTPYRLATFWEGLDGIYNQYPVELTYEQIENNVVFYMGNATLADRQENGRKAKTVDMLSTYSYLFNTEKELFKYSDVRYALSIALDREAMTDAITFGKAATALHTESKKILSKEANIAEAKAILANVPGFDTMDKSFTLTVENNEEAVKLAEMAKQTWESLGFSVTVKTVGCVESNVKDESTDSVITIHDSEMQALVKEAALGYVTYDVIGYDFQLYSDDSFVALCAFTEDMNGNGYDMANGKIRSAIATFGSDTEASTKYTSLLHQAFAATKKNERKKLLAEAETLLLTKGVIVPVFHRQNFAYVSGKLSGVTVTGNGFFNLTKVSLRNYTKYALPEDEDRKKSA